MNKQKKAQNKHNQGNQKHLCFVDLENHQNRLCHALFVNLRYLQIAQASAQFSNSQTTLPIYKSLSAIHKLLCAIC